MGLLGKIVDICDDRVFWSGGSELASLDEEILAGVAVLALVVEEQLPAILGAREHEDVIRSAVLAHDRSKLEGVGFLLAALGFVLLGLPDVIQNAESDRELVLDVLERRDDLVAFLELVLVGHQLREDVKHDERESILGDGVHKVLDVIGLGEIHRGELPREESQVRGIGVAVGRVDVRPAHLETLQAVLLGYVEDLLAADSEAVKPAY